ncbi:hypothetical protein [Rhodococcus qingshengii]|uniref:hypothetical protein n=1 Tax=Rhodococcus qingshengii TaxID=334542 RepID=UPI001C241313|nr:hypothetical protein [Rhodococcus qingshengii]QXC46203.1 hypothetical protein KSE96_31075 [Rhodococcus qingshengii]
MARGKHRQAKHNRDMREAQDKLAAVRAELAEEERLHEAALKARAEADELKRELDSACADRDRACQAEVDRLGIEIAALGPWVKSHRALYRRVHDRWDKMLDPITDALGGGGIEGLESYMAVIDAEDSVILQLDVADRRQITQEAATAIQRARGGRRSNQPKKHYTEAQKQMRKELLASRLPADDHRADADVDDETRHRTLGTLFDRTPAAVSAWHPASWIAEPSPDSAGSAQALGLVLGEEHTDFPEGPSIPTQAHATLSAATRNALSGLPPRQIFTTWQRAYAAGTEQALDSRIRLPIAAMPRHPIPADAASLQHWYTAAAWGSALRYAGGAGSCAPSRIAVATQAAVPFWLPPGHTLNYADSEPLSAEDRADIRLPYAQVFLAFADPLRLDAAAPSTPEMDESWEWMTRVVTDVLGRGQTRSLGSMLLAGTRGFTTERVDLCDMIEQRGARIEGLVLLADAVGRLDDEFAWCVTIPAKSGGVLGRWTLPASLGSTAFRDQVINLAAVAAWGDWHSAAEETDGHITVRESADGESAARKDAAVRVLNVKATGRAESGAAQGTGAQVAPHIRRGHWRRQRYGPKRSLERRVRIAPVLVNAARGDIGPRVYRLPSLPREGAAVTRQL